MPFFHEALLGGRAFYRTLVCRAAIPPSLYFSGLINLEMAKDRDMRINVLCGLFTAQTENF